MILLVDNFDSFVHNLARYFQRLGQCTAVVRNDAVDVELVLRLAPQALVISPGPGNPRQAGCVVALIRRFLAELPILGVCLGHQAIVEALGGAVVRSATPMHGRVSSIRHERCGLFDGLPSPLQVCRYHSLTVDPLSLPSELSATALTANGEIMAVQHRRLPVYGVQFHPEAILTDCGYALLANFLRAADCDVDVGAANLMGREIRASAVAPASLPSGPITF